MGAALPRFARAIRKPLETQRSLDKVLEGKPAVAPKHPSTQASMEELKTKSQEEFLERDRNDEAYLNLLKGVRVDSTDPGPNVTGDRTEPAKTQRNLPQSRIWEPTQIGEVPKGRITEEKLSELLVHNMKSPDTWNIDKLATHYELDKETLASILKFYSEYAVVEKRNFPQPMEDVSFLK